MRNTDHSAFSASVSAKNKTSWLSGNKILNDRSTPYMASKSSTSFLRAATAGSWSSSIPIAFFRSIVAKARFVTSL